MSDAFRLFLTAEQPCPYLPGRKARNLVADPEATAQRADLYGQLSLQGFRRSGGFVYRPHCPACAACIPLRIPAAEFRARRYQRRIWHRNRGLEHREQPAAYRDEHFLLYRRYLRDRHPGSPMANASATDYMEFLTAGWSDTRFHEFALAGRVVAVAVTDHLDEGLSSIYTFFDPDLAAARSLGTYAILWQIEHARRLGLPWVFLGYWIRSCREMSYKGEFRPFETLQEGKWVRTDNNDPAGG